MARKILLSRFLVALLFLITTSPVISQETDTAATEAVGARVAADVPGDTPEATTGEPDLARGEKLFRGNCASCHRVTGELVGPQLLGAKEKWVALPRYEGQTGEEWFYAWVKNSQAVVNAGMPYGMQIFNQYNKSIMPAFGGLTNEDIDAIFAFVAAPPATPGPEDPDGDDVTAAAGSDRTTKIILGVLLGVLVILALVLGRVTNVLNKLAREKEGLPGEPSTPFYKSKKILVTAILLLVVFIGYTAVDIGINFGRQQGYQPDQPIPFSHKLHAGVLKINCQYCHDGAAKGKNAVIPSVDNCMNCHTAIKQGPTAEFKAQHDLSGPAADTSEIAKIYAAYENNQPIEWVRIHNLPDHVYFNHAQHVTVAGLDCQTCHGPVETMEKVYQHAPLSMGWCISCHRVSEVNFVANDYYEIYEKFHQQLKAGDISRVTVEKIGGTDCQKCHY